MLSGCFRIPVKMPVCSRLAVLWAPIAWLALAGGVAGAHDYVPHGYRAYQLREAQATEIAPKVRSLIVTADPAAEVVFDRQTNRVLVKGRDAAQQLAAQLIETLDRPAASVRAAASQRDQGVTRATALEPVQSVGREKRATMSLRNARWSDLEAHLRRVGGDRARWSTDPEGKITTVQFPTPGGSATQLTVDRRASQVTIAGADESVAAWQRALKALDSRRRRDESTQLVRLWRADPRQVREVVQWLNASSQLGDEANERVLTALPLDQQDAAGGMASRIFQPKGSVRVAQRDTAQRGQQPDEELGGQFQQPDDAQGDQFQPNGNQPQPPDGQPLDQPPAVGVQPDTGAAALLQASGLIGNVRITIIEELGIVVIAGRPRDVQTVIRLIEQIEAQSALTRPIVEIYPLRHVDGQAITDLLAQVYGNILAARQGQVTIIPLIKPNSLLLIGRRESVDAVIDLVRRLDEPTPRARFRVFRLRYMSAVDAETRLTTFYANQGVGLGPRVLTVSDYRSNTLIVLGSERDLEEVAAILEAIDTIDSGVTNEIRVFRLTNTLAVDVQPVLQDAINGQLQGAGRGTTVGQAGVLQQQQAVGQLPAGQVGAAQIRSAALSFLDLKEGQLMRSGLMFDVRVTAISSANALVVVAPSESMELIAAVIEQLDQLPDAQAQIKVFTIVNGDATTLATTLQTLFGQVAGAQQQALIQALALTTGGESSLVPLRFAVDVRTNSIIATGSRSDLEVVYSVLVMLDQEGVGQRKTTVFRLKNSPATDVAAAITDLLTQQRQINAADPTLLSPAQLIEREVIVVPEVVSNSLIVSATPRFYDEVVDIVNKLDARPPMVMIQVVIAEVTLDDIEEFGVEMGVQDSLVFDRGIGVVGFPFNTGALGNNSDALALSTRETLAGQALQNLTVGSVNGQLGYGGLVLRAGNESINILIRALQDKRRLQVLSRPQVMTLDNQPAFVQVGARVPRITSSQITTTGTINTTVLENVGLILGVTPRTSPDGLVVMEIDAEKSELGPEAEGVPISINDNGDVIRSPQINITTAQTTISARSGQTVVFAGLITKNRSRVSRRIPIASDIPIVGRIFRFDTDVEGRTELLIIMTPYIVREDQDAEVLKHMESSRMSWALADVVEMHGEGGLSPGYDLWGEGEPPAIYPKTDPATAAWRFLMGTGWPDMVVPPLLAPVRIVNDSPLPDLLDPLDLRYRLWPWKPLAEPRGPVLNRNREMPPYGPGMQYEFSAGTQPYEEVPEGQRQNGDQQQLPPPGHGTPDGTAPQEGVPQSPTPQLGTADPRTPQQQWPGADQDGSTSSLAPVLVSRATALESGSSRRRTATSGQEQGEAGGSAPSTALYAEGAIDGAVGPQGATVRSRLFGDRADHFEE